MLWLMENVDQIAFSELAHLLPKLSPGRRERILSMTNEPAMVRSALAELLLLYALREEYGLTYLPRTDTGEKGKPFFPDRPEICFNLSHCKTAVACALDASPVGVDVQEVRSPCRAAPDTGKAPPVYRVLSETERVWVEAGQTPEIRDRRFTAVWTCKEAWGKALGVGYLYDLQSTAFRPKKRPWQQYGFTFRYLDLGDTCLTLCAGRALRLRRVRFAHLRSCLSEETT